jgi:hypothetical protein
MVRSGDSLRILLGEDYDIVAFDPRCVTRVSLLIMCSLVHVSVGLDSQLQLSESSTRLKKRPPGTCTRRMIRCTLKLPVPLHEALPVGLSLAT